MNKIKELFDFVDVLSKNSKYNILTNGEVIAYNDEGYTWDGGSRPQREIIIGLRSFLSAGRRGKDTGPGQNQNQLPKEIHIGQEN